MSQWNLGVMHQNGQGVPQNIREGGAMAHECSGARTCRGAVLHGDGQSVSQNFKEVVRWLTKAAEKGDAAS